MIRSRDVKKNQRGGGVSEKMSHVILCMFLLILEMRNNAIIVEM